MPALPPASTPSKQGAWFQRPIRAPQQSQQQPLWEEPVSGESNLFSSFHGNRCSFLPVSWLQGKTRTSKRRKWQQGEKKKQQAPPLGAQTVASPQVGNYSSHWPRAARPQVWTLACSSGKGESWTRDDPAKSCHSKTSESSGLSNKTNHWKGLASSANLGKRHH